MRSLATFVAATTSLAAISVATLGELLTGTTSLVIGLILSLTAATLLIHAAVGAPSMCKSALVSVAAVTYMIAASYVLDLVSDISFLNMVAIRRGIAYALYLDLAWVAVSFSRTWTAQRRSAEAFRVGVRGLSRDAI